MLCIERVDVLMLLKFADRDALTQPLYIDEIWEPFRNVIKLVNVYSMFGSWRNLFTLEADFLEFTATFQWSNWKFDADTHGLKIFRLSYSVLLKL